MGSTHIPYMPYSKSFHTANHTAIQQKKLLYAAVWRPYSCTRIPFWLLYDTAYSNFSHTAAIQHYYSITAAEAMKHVILYLPTPSAQM